MPRKIEPSNWTDARFSGLADPIDKTRRAEISKTLGVDEISDDVVTALQKALGELIGDITSDRQRPNASQTKTALRLIQDHAENLHQILFHLDDVSFDFLVSQLLQQPGKTVVAAHTEIKNTLELLKKLNRAAGSAILTVDEKIKIEGDVVSHHHKFSPPPNRPLRIFISQLAHIFKEVTGEKPTGYYSDVYDIKGKFFLFVENCLACLPDDAHPNHARPSDIALGQIIKETLQAININL